VHDGYRRVLNRTFELPDGGSAEFEVVDLQDSVVVLALTADAHVVLARQFRPGPEEVLLELPGGVVDDGYSAVEAARAELIEETGYEGELQLAGTMLVSAYATKTKHVFVGENCVRTREPAEKFIEPVLVTLPQFREHLRRGRLTDTDGGYRALDFLGLLGRQDQS
jgi:ADP-ribose pyrophosphatase